MDERMMQLAVEALTNIAHELAQANRLKAIELKHQPADGFTLREERAQEIAEVMS